MKTLHETTESIEHIHFSISIGYVPGKFSYFVSVVNRSHRGPPERA